MGEGRHWWTLGAWGCTYWEKSHHHWQGWAKLAMALLQSEAGAELILPGGSIFCGDTWISVPMRGDGYCKATLFLVLLLAGEWECNTILATLMSPCPLHPTFILEQLFPHITRSLQKGLFALESAKNELVLQSRVRCGQCWEGLRLCPHHHHQLQKEGFPYMWQDRG